MKNILSLFIILLLVSCSEQKLELILLNYFPLLNSFPLTQESQLSMQVLCNGHSVLKRILSLSDMVF